MKYKEYKPKWMLESGDKNSYRYWSRWGNQAFSAEPSEALYVFIKERLNLSDEDFIQSLNAGNVALPERLEGKLPKREIAEFEDIVGSVNVLTDTVSRISCAYGKSCYDSVRLRNEILENIPDIVITPTSEEQIITILEYCYNNNIPLYPTGGRTNTSRTTECYRGGVMLDLRRNYNKIISFNEVDQTVTVMAGISGLELEEILNNAPEYLDKVSYKYTCGHIPQSFEFSTVGGWIMSRSYGANHTRYGDIGDILLSAKYLTSRGIIDTAGSIASAPIPSIDQVMIGSCGEYCVLLSATLRIRRHFPDNKRLFSYLFRDFDSAVRCAKEIMQSEVGRPSSLRICDADDTEIIMRANAVVDKGLIAPFVRKLAGSTQRCLVIGSVEGSAGYSRMVKRHISRMSARYGGVSSTSYLSKKREKNMFSDNYIRDLLLDYNVVMDDICCNTCWSKMMVNYQSIKEIIADRKHTFSRVHIKKMTTQGCMIVCEYVGKFDTVDEYYEYRQMIIDKLSEVTNTVCFSHSIGRENSHKLRECLGEAHQGALEALKSYFDPKNLINPK